MLKREDNGFYLKLEICGNKDRVVCPATGLEIKLCQHLR